MSFVEVDEHSFELTNARTWGVRRDKEYGGFTIPIVLDEGTASELTQLSIDHGAVNPVKKNGTLYLKCKKLTDKQSEELCGRGRCCVSVRFTLTGLFTKGERTYLVLKVRKLGRVPNTNSDSDSDCPED